LRRRAERSPQESRKKLERSTRPIRVS
jgi:hypothetical protein